MYFSEGLWDIPKYLIQYLIIIKTEGITYFMRLSVE